MKTTHEILTRRLVQAVMDTEIKVHTSPPCPEVDRVIEKAVVRAGRFRDLTYYYCVPNAVPLSELRDAIKAVEEYVATDVAFEYEGFDNARLVVMSRGWVSRSVQLVGASVAPRAAERPPCPAGVTRVFGVGPGPPRTDLALAYYGNKEAYEAATDELYAELY